MIISASRRTDIPAWHSQWFFNRVKAGEVLCRNPYRPTQISRVSLSPEVVDCIVFWTKNPAPMFGLLKPLEEMGHSFYFQFTLTPYGKDLEPGLPQRERLLETFWELSRQIGPERVIWRYDPVVLTPAYPVEYHMQAFERLAHSLKGATRRCVFSFFDNYSFLGAKGKEWAAALTRQRMERLACAFSKAAASSGMELVTCAEQGDFSQYGIRHGACIDQEWIEALLHSKLDCRSGASRPQRPLCGCMESVDIGAYGTCGHGCLYCYARRGQNVQKFDMESPLLDGYPRPGDTVRIKEGKRLLAPQQGQLSFFPSHG